MIRGEGGGTEKPINQVNQQGSTINVQNKNYHPYMFFEL